MLCHEAFLKGAVHLLASSKQSLKDGCQEAELDSILVSLESFLLNFLRLYVEILAKYLGDFC